MKLSYSPHPGMLVRCVDDEFDGVATFVVPRLPQRGIIYTVRDVCVRDVDPAVALRFYELFNPSLSHGGWRGEPGFFADRFVPVDPRALDVFRKQEVDA